MKPDQVQPVRPGNPNDALPRCQVRGRMSGLWKNAALQRAAEKCSPSVDCELRPRGPNFPQTEIHDALRLPQFRRQMLQRGMKFIPQLCAIAQFDFAIELRPVGVPSHRNHFE